MNKYRCSEGTRNSPLATQHSDTCRQDPLMDGKISRWKFGKKHISSLKVSLPSYVFITEGKIVTIYWRNPADTPRSDEDFITSNQSCWRHLPPIWRPERALTSVVFLPKGHSLHLITWQHQTNPNWGIRYKVTDQVFCRNVKIMKDKERLSNCHTLEKIKEVWQLNSV